MDFFVCEKRGKGMKFIKTKTGIFYTITFLLIMVLSLSYASFKIITNEYKVTDLRIGNLMYGIEISSLGGEETISGNTVSLSSGKVTAVEIKINSLNSIISNYGVDYKITSGEGKVYYGSTTIDKVSDTIDNYNTSTTKIVKVFIEATTDITVEFNISGGYQYNTKVEEKTGYTRIAEMYTDSFKVTMNVTNGTSDAVSKTTTFNGSTTFTITPNEGYTLEEAEVNCTGGTLTNNTLTINNIRKNITCEVTLQEDGAFKSGTLAAQILIDNPTVSERTDFSVTNTATTTGTIYQTNKTEDGSTVYYYSGNTANNWVKFGGFYWRVIRTNEDKSVRMLYAGTSHNTTSGHIGTSAYNSSYNNPMYVGYMYGTTDSLENNRSNANDSTIKTVIDTWYKNNLLTNYDKYISKTAIYCNDRSVESGTYSITTYNPFSYGGYIRIYTNKTPSYKCGASTSNGLIESTQSVADKFSASTTGGGNGQLTYPIALMTTDEVAFAGGLYGALNTKAWYYTNSNGKSPIVGSTAHWCTMTPQSGSASGSAVMCVCNSDDPGLIRGNLPDTENRVRPALSLKACVKYSSGNGTPESPYEVTIDDICVSAEN